MVMILSTINHHYYNKDNNSKSREYLTYIFHR
nr:MAG TPA: hypothetical protein [Caudoviricetes sp.]